VRILEIIWTTNQTDVHSSTIKITFLTISTLHPHPEANLEEISIEISEVNPCSLAILSIAMPVQIYGSTIAVLYANTHHFGRGLDFDVTVSFFDWRSGDKLDVSNWISCFHMALC
jgi:hypothetical protein